MKFTEKDVMMMFHTTVRNMGLFTSISLGLLGYSRFYRSKNNQMYNIAFIVFSLIFLGCSISIGRYLLLDIQNINKESKMDKKAMTHKWLMIPEIIIGINSLIFIFGFYTLLRQMSISD